MVHCLGHGAFKMHSTLYAHQQALGTHTAPPKMQEEHGETVKTLAQKELCAKVVFHTEGVIRLRPSLAVRQESDCQTGATRTLRYLLRAADTGTLDGLASWSPDCTRRLGGSLGGVFPIPSCCVCACCRVFPPLFVSDEPPGGGDVGRPLHRFWGGVARRRSASISRSKSLSGQLVRMAAGRVH